MRDLWQSPLCWLCEMRSGVFNVWPTHTHTLEPRDRGASSPAQLADHDGGVVGELVGGDLQVGGGGALADAPGHVVVRAVTRAVVAAVLAGVRNRHAACTGNKRSYNFRH